MTRKRRKQRKSGHKRRAMPRRATNRQRKARPRAKNLRPIRRTQRARVRKRRSRRRTRNKPIVPRTARQLFAMSKPAQEEWKEVTNIVNEARRTRKSARKIAQQRGIPFKTVRKRAGRALHRQRNGRIVPRPTDDLLRVLVLPTSDGMREVATRDSRQASLVAQYWIAVSRYLESGDASSLQTFKGKHVTDAGGKRVPLLTDSSELDLLASAGVLSFESIYAKR